MLTTPSSAGLNLISSLGVVDGKLYKIFVGKKNAVRAWAKKYANDE